MSAPAGYPRHSEDRRVQLLGQAEHLINEARIKVDVGRNALVHLPVLRDDLRGELFDTRVQAVFSGLALFDGQLLDEALEHLRSRVGDRVYRVSDTVDEAAFVISFLVEYLFEISGDLVVVLPVAHVLFDILHHTHDAQVSAAVLGAFQRAQSRRDGRICIRAGRGDDAGGEGRVVAAAVLGVEYQREVEHLGLQGCEGAVGSQRPEQHLGRRLTGKWVVDIQTVALRIMVVRLIRVHREQGEQRYELEALSEHVVDAQVHDVVIVRSEGQHGLGERVHEVLARSLEDNVAHEVLGQHARVGQKLHKVVKLILSGELREQQQIHYLFKTVASVGDTAADDVDHVDPAIKELAVGGDGLSVHDLVLAYLADVGESGENALAVEVAQTDVDIILLVQSLFDISALYTCARELLYPLIACAELCHAFTSLKMM